MQIAAELIARETYGPIQELCLRSPRLARRLYAGQAVLVRAGWALEPFLRRTLYPIAIDSESWTLRLPPGADWGHAWLRSVPLGTQIDCLGPVGRGFSVAPATRNLLCIGEGAAAWELLPAVVTADRQGLSTALAVKSSSPRDTIPPARLPAGVEYRVAMGDGTPGDTQQLADTLGEWLAWADSIFAAGTPAFYTILAGAIKTARFGIRRGIAQALYHQTFFCGVGACQSCVAELPNGRRRVCLRGPVFDLADLVPEH
jgi:dihydroorotate dehydrogenase electron transfer subunit